MAKQRKAFKQDERTRFKFETLRLTNQFKAPAAPPSGALELYIKENFVYKLTSSGKEVPIDKIENKTVSPSSSPGIVGQVALDTNYLYVCVAPNQWKRISLTSY